MTSNPEIELVHVKLPKALLKQVDHIAVDEDIYRQTAMARLLAFAVAATKNAGGRIPEPGAV